jgi:hypothetical protein
MGVFTAALLFLFTATAAVPADAKQASLKSMLRSNGIGMKIVRLDRVDGFLFGLSFTGPKRTIVIAPGLDKMLLVQVDGNDVILQRDETGKFQVIQAEGDFSYILCIAQSVISFLSDLTVCGEGNTSCLFTSVVSLVTNIMACSNAAVPTE